MDAPTPAMKQYMELKTKHPDCVLFFRIGDFYETFYEDAKVTSKTLDIVLTKRRFRRTEQSIPLAGIPYHALDSYLGKMVRAGHKVAIVEQLEDPEKAKGIVRRGIVRIVTPGTVIDSNMLGKGNNFMMSLFFGTEGFGISFLDISTSEFSVTVVKEFEDVMAETMKHSPKEIIIPDSYSERKELDEFRNIGLRINPVEDLSFFEDRAKEVLEKQFKAGMLRRIKHTLGVSAAGALLHYARYTQHSDLSYIDDLKWYATTDAMVLDASTIRNLEIVSNIADGTNKSTLVAVLDRTLTPMGTRKMRQVLQRPLNTKDRIEKRLTAVASLVSDPMLLEDIREVFKEMPDIERIINRVNYGNASPRDLVALKEGIEACKGTSRLFESESKLLRELSDLPKLDPVIKDIDETVKDDPGSLMSKSNIIKAGHNKDLDELRKISSNAKGFIRTLQEKEREATGINSLKIGFNKVFGYYIEVSKPNLHLVPGNYVKKQTLANAERFITQDIKEKESVILNAEDRMQELELSLFADLVERVAKSTSEIRELASKISMLDVMCSFALVSMKQGYSKPEICDGFKMDIKGGRHPVIETNSQFIPNDASLDEGNRMMIITGPNMAGKSTYMRQVAIITLMAHIGSFVPAESAKIPLVDRIFTRVGAFDDISRGQSTFMVEMTQTSNIVNNATDRSLIILDEIGRGTSTFDGVSIAWAVAEYLAKDVKAKTLFATHYHILNRMESEIEGVKNYNIAVKEDQDKIIFLRKICEGGTDKSYGIHVARLAGMPEKIIKNSRAIQKRLESEDDIAERIVIPSKKNVSKTDKKSDTPLDMQVQRRLIDI